MRSYLNILGCGLIVATNLIYSVPVTISRADFAQKFFHRISELTGIPSEQLNGGTSLASLEDQDSTIRRDLIGYTRDMLIGGIPYFSQLDDAGLDNLLTVEEAIDYLYQFIKPIDVQAEGDALDGYGYGIGHRYY